MIASRPIPHLKHRKGQNFFLFSLRSVFIQNSLSDVIVQTVEKHVGRADLRRGVHDLVVVMILDVAPPGNLKFRFQSRQGGDLVHRDVLFQQANRQQNRFQIFDNEQNDGQRLLIEIAEVPFDRRSIGSADQIRRVQPVSRLEFRLEIVIDRGENGIPRLDLQLTKFFRMIRTVENGVPVEKVHDLLDQLRFRRFQRIVDQGVDQRVQVHRRQIDLFRLLLPFLSQGRGQEFVLDRDQIAQGRLQFALVE